MTPSGVHRLIEAYRTGRIHLSSVPYGELRLMLDSVSDGRYGRSAEAIRRGIAGEILQRHADANMNDVSKRRTKSAGGSQRCTGCPCWPAC